MLSTVVSIIPPFSLVQRFLYEKGPTIGKPAGKFGGAAPMQADGSER
jgi:hypothetical protein